ncbi:MAG: VIT and vWA domain-containing protein [Gemmatimonadaceae bacterium]
MRHLALIAVLSLAAPLELFAQGRIIPRPCVPERCPPGRAPGIERVSSDVRVVMRDRVLHFEVEEVFANRGGMIGEADYLFPLPKGAAFQDLKLSIDGEPVAGETLGADEARRIYEEIVRRQRDPALVEWMGHGLLRTRIFPIAPGEERRVVVRYQQVAQREGDALRVDHFRGSRSGPRPGDTRGDDPRRDGSIRQDAIAATTFTLTYEDNRALGAPYSPTHGLDIDRSGGRTTVNVRGDATDLTLLLPLRCSGRAAISVLTHAPGNGDGFALIVLTPPAVDQTDTPRAVTFVLDISGSMSGRKMEQARAAGRQLLATLDSDDHFRLIDFATEVHTFREGFVRATRDNIRAAERYLETLESGGSTNIMGALEEALRPSGISIPEGFPLVLFITDGEPTVGERDPAAIAERASEIRDDTRVFTFGLGADVNSTLVERLALEGRGVAHFVRPDESVERTVAVAASRLTSPVATNVRLEADGVRLSRAHPMAGGTVDIFAGEDLVVFARYDGEEEGDITFTGDAAHGQVRWRATARFPDRSRENSYIPRLWATQRVGYLSAEKRRGGGSAELDDEIRQLGERYGIPTEFTSYFVREPGMMISQDGTRRDATGVRRGAVTDASSPPAAAKERAFSAARTAADQRKAESAVALDAIVQQAYSSAPAADLPRRAGSRLFDLRDGVWVDVAYADSVHTVRVEPFSEAYFRLVELIPDLREPLALGERVIVRGRNVAIATDPDGVQRLDEREVRTILGQW